MRCIAYLYWHIHNKYGLYLLHSKYVIDDTLKKAICQELPWSINKTK